MIKKNYFIGFFLMLNIFVFGQPRTELSLEEAYALLEKNYPILQNSGLLQQIYQKELEQIDIAQKPMLRFKTDGQLVSEKVQLETNGAMLPFEIDRPIFSIKTYVEAQYLILDGGMMEAKKKIKEAQLHAALQDIEVNRFALRKRINDLFFGIMLLREQSKLLDISLKNIQSRKKQVAAGLEMGVLLESELTKLEVKELQIKTTQDNLKFQISGLSNTLSDWIGVELAEDVQFKFPTLPPPAEIPDLHRPEQKQFQLQKAAILSQMEMVDVAKKPKLSAFAQAGIGYPNPLNFLSSDIAPFGILGVQFSWQITDWKKSEKDKDILNLQAQKLNHAAATFDFNMNAQKSKYLADVNRLLFQIEQDQKITKLQTKILEQLAAQLDEGVITSTDYIIQLNAELASRQNLLIHQTELAKVQLDFWNERGGFEK